MGYTAGYKYDVFISYSRLDNQDAFGKKTGWVTEFYTSLYNLLTLRTGRVGGISIWWDDTKLDGNVLFDASIEEAIKQSAVIICINSNAYLTSEYCKKERDTFYTKALQEPIGLKV